MKKRFLSILLAALMLLSLLPVSALAEAQPMNHLGFSLSGMTLDLINAEDHGGFLRYSYGCAVMFSEAVYQLGSPEYLGYWYGADEEDLAFPLSDGNGHTLTVTGKWGVEKLEAGQTDVTVPVELDIDADDYAAVHAGTYTGTIVLDALVLGRRASDNEYCYYLEEYATATVKLVIPGYDVNVSNPTGCTITADKRENIREGETVHVSYALDEGYYLQALSVTDAGGYSLPLSADGAFTMPAQNVTVTGATIPPHELTFMKAVGLMQNFDWFTPAADKTSPVRYGDTVNLSVNFDETDPDSLGWSLDHWEVKNPESGQIVELNADGCSFTMPNFKVRAIPVLKYEDPNQPGTGTIIDPDPGIAPDTEKHVVLWRNDGTNTLPTYITLRTEGDYVSLPKIAPFSHEDWTICGWSLSADDSEVCYSNGDSVEVSSLAQGASLSLYAVWEKKTTFTLELPESLSVGYRAASLTFPIQVTALELKNGVSAIQFGFPNNWLIYDEAPTFTAPGSMDVTLFFMSEFWMQLPSGQQTFDLKYRIFDDYGSGVLSMQNWIEMGKIPLLIDVPEKYEVTADDGITGGSVTLKNAKYTTVYAEGETVRLTVSPNTKYVLDEGSLTGSYTDGTGAVHTVEITGSGRSYSFTMPAYPVTVTASFSPLVSGGNTPEPETFSVPVRVVDADTGEGVADKELKLTAPDGGVRISVSDEEGFADFPDVTPCGDSQTYVLSVEDALYDQASVEFYLLEDGRIVSTGTVDESGCLLLPVTKKTAEVRVSVLDAESGEPRDGAVVMIYDCNGGVIDSWTSKTGEIFCSDKISAGVEYTLRVEGVPDGWCYPEAAAFTVYADGSVDYEGNTATDEAGHTVLLVEMEKTSVRVHTMYDGSFDPWKEACIDLQNHDGTIIQTWEGGVIDLMGLIAGETYTLHATSAPEGYLLPANTTFHINEDGSVEYNGNTESDDEGNLVLLVEFEKTRVRFDAVDAVRGERLAGALIDIYNSDNVLVESWTSSESETHCVEGLSVGETYTLHTAYAPEGYLLPADTFFHINADGSVEYNGSTTTDDEGNPVLLVELEWARVRIDAVDVGTGERLAGVLIDIYDPDGVLVEEWTSSDNETHCRDGLFTGAEFTLHADSAPEGYLLPADTIFSLNADGSVVYSGDSTVDDDGNPVLLVELEKTCVCVEAIDVGTGEPLWYAGLEILNENGEAAESWESGSMYQLIEGLAVGQTYTLRAAYAPEGYLLPADTTFRINEDGSVDYSGDSTTDEDGSFVLLAEFEKTLVCIDAVNAAGETLWYAGLELLDENDEVVESWESGGMYRLLEGLAVGETYTLHATSAPEGYLLPANTAFRINEDGSVDYSGETVMADDGRLVMLLAFEKTLVRIDAVDVGTGERLEGAVMQLLNADGDVVDEWTSGSELYCVEGLTAGEEYALRVAIPADGYCVGPEAPFTIEFDGCVSYNGNTATDDEGNPVLLAELAATRVCFSVRDADTGEGLPGVTVHITDYAGSVVTDWISDDTGYHAVERLIAGVDYTVRVIDAPEDYLPPEDASFAIDPDGTVTYSGNTGTNNIFETLLLVELKGVRPAYRLGGENVMFFDENSRRITWAREGQTVIVSPAFETIPAGYWFIGAYKAVPAAEITVDEVGDGSFTMPAEAVTVSLVLAGQEDYDLLLADGEPVELPAEMAANLSGTSAYFYDETLDAGVLDLNGDGEPDVLLDFDADTAQRLAGADAITHCVTLSIDSPVPYRFRAVCFRFDENQSAGPVITQQPADVSVPLGELARTRVVAEGEGLKYQWYGREANGREFKSGLRGDTYSVALVKSKIGRTVWCVITDAEGNTVTTREAVLNVAYPDDYVYPTITADAADCFVDAGGSVSVAIGAEGCGELSYQWYILNKGSQTWAKSGIKGVGADTYSCAMNGTRDGRQIYCVVTDAWGNTATSSTVTIGFDCPVGYEGPGVTVNADDIHTDVDAGEYASVTVTAAGPNGDAEGLSYQWYLRADENAPWSRSSLKGDTYSVKMIPSKSGRQVKCVVTDAYGKKTESAVFTLTMVIPAEYANGPQIVTQPENVTVARGEIAATTVAADGVGLSYQWYLRADENAPWSRSSLKGDTYSVKMIPSKSGRQVRCVVTDKYGRTVTSDVATLTMAP